MRHARERCPRRRHQHPATPPVTICFFHGPLRALVQVTQPTDGLDGVVPFDGTTSFGAIIMRMGGSLGRAMRLTSRVTAQRPICSVPRSIDAGRGLSIASPDTSL